MIPKICAVALLSAFVGVLLSEFGFRSKKLFGVLSIVIVIVGLGDGIVTVFERLTSLSATAGISDAASCVIKTVGVGYVFGFTSEVCSELGEGGIANAVTLAGKIEVFLIALPYFEKAINLGLELIK